MDYILELLKKYDEIKEKSKVIHHITNYITGTDSAKLCSLMGFEPVMADHPLEVAQITSKSDYLVLNLGTPKDYTHVAMLKAGKTAKRNNIPIIFDPVGCSLSGFRRKISLDIIKKKYFDILKGNLSEINYIIEGNSSQKGVSSTSNPKIAKNICISASKKLECVVSITGQFDYISNQKRICTIKNGNSILKKIPGTGCLISSLIAMALSLSNDFFNASIIGNLVMSVAGELMDESNELDVIKTITKINSKILEERMRIEIEEI